MAYICFDCLIDDFHAQLLLHRFEELSALLIRDGVIGSKTQVKCEPILDRDNYIEQQLRSIYVKDRGGEGGDGEISEQTANLKMYCYLVTPEDVAGSLNDLAMTYSRLMTPPAPNPQDPLKLATETESEVPATFPWFVSMGA